MGEAAPQAAEGMSAEEIGNALEALRFDWGGFYMIGYDDVRGWWAALHGRIRGLITAGGPGELRAAMAEDFGPVKA